MTHQRRLQAVRWSDRVAFAALVLAVSACLLREHPFWRPKVTVRSCGGNFELLCAIVPDFQRRHACRVEYLAAPVQYLLELAAADPDHLPEVMVGRSGPGWALLQRQARLAGPPRCFAMDPLVIVTPSGNPAGVRSLVDLGREGVRVLAAPEAMRPKGRVVGSLMADVSEALHPGLVDRWERNTVAELPCGRLLARRLQQGRGDAAVLARSQTAQPPLAGACEVVEIPPDILNLMRSGRGSLPQSVGRTVRNPGNELADRFVAELAEGAGGRVEASGYLPRGGAAYARYEALLRAEAAQPMAERQMALAAALARDGAPREAVRRYLHVIHGFGPSRWDAEAWFRIGAILRGMGDQPAARRAWLRLLARYPTRGHKEWLGILAMGDDVGTDPEQPWVDRAAWMLAAIPADTPPAGASRWQADVTPRPFTVREGDSPKGARRTLAVAVDLLDLGLGDFAARDALKVATLHSPSPHMPAARTVAGTASLGAGVGTVGRDQWQQVVTEHPTSPWAGPCARALAASAGLGSLRPSGACPVPMPPFVPDLQTHAGRAMAYAGELWDAGLTLYSLKEYLKVVSGVYGESGPVTEARFRAGVCLATMGRAGAARRQWDLCQAAPGSDEWQPKAMASAALLGEPGPWLDADLRHAIEVPTAVTSRPAGDGGAKQRRGTLSQAVARLHLGEELLIAGVLDEDEALQEFLKVVTVVQVPPHLAWVPVTAHLRAAQALVLAGRLAAARAHAELAARAEGPAECTAQAARLLAYLGPEGRPNL